MHLRVGKTAELVTCILLQVKQKPAAVLLCARPTQRPQGWGEEWLGFLLLPSPLIIITTLKGRQWGPPFRLGETEALSWLRSHSQKPSAGRGSVCKRNPLDRAPSSTPELPQALRPFSTEPGLGARVPAVGHQTLHESRLWAPRQIGRPCALSSLSLFGL